jgi:curved DNA-binding protein CbpA
MMKDYYKILGVKKNVTEEEMRARWIKLTKRYHPDRGKPNISDEKIKEINEAYDVLKDESTRFDYDFKRGLEKPTPKKGERGGDRFSTKKIFIPMGVLILFIIVGFVALRWGLTGLKPEPVKLYKIKPTVEIRIPPPNPSLKIDSEAKASTEAPKEVIKVVPPKTTKVPQISAPSSTSLPLTLAKGELDSKKGPSRQEGSKSEVPFQVEKEASREVREVMPRERSQSVTGTREDRKSIEEPSDQSVLKQEALPQPEQEVLKGISKETSQQGAKVISVLPPLLAKEEEVRRFFAEYINRYTKKDIHGFLSVFSSKAIQNQKDELEAIKNIYSRFLNQGDELRYHLDDMKIEIYQNVVEVKARYKLDQILEKQGSEKTWRGDIRWVLIREGGVLKIISLDYQNEKTP